MKKSYPIFLLLLICCLLSISKVSAQDNSFYEKQNTYESRISELQDKDQLDEALKIYKLMFADELAYKRDEKNAVCLNYIQKLIRNRYNEFKNGFFFIEEIANKITVEKLTLGDLKEYSKVCEELSTGFRQLQQFQKAELYINKAITIIEKTEKGKNSREYKDLLEQAQELKQLNFGLAIRDKKTDDALKIMKEDTSVLPVTAKNLKDIMGIENENLAISMVKMGLKRSLRQSSIEQKLTNQLIDPNYVKRLDSLVKIPAYKEAEELIATSISNVKPQLLNPFTEAEQEFVVSKMRVNFEANLSYITNRIAQNPQLAILAYNQAIQSHALLLSQQQRIREHILVRRNQKTKSIYDKWIKQRNHLGQLYLKTPQELNKLGINIYDEQAACSNLEEELNVSANITIEEIAPIYWTQIKEKLKDKEAAIELIRFNYINKTKKIEEVYYAALVLRFDDKIPHFITIKNGKELETVLYEKYKTTLTSKSNDNDVYNNYWLPIQDELTGIKRIYLALDGIYHNININTLPIPNNANKCLIDELSICLLNSTRDIITQKTPLNVENPSAVLIARPNYDLVISNSNIKTPSVIRSKRDINSLIGQQWKDLPETETEVSKIVSILSKNKFKIETFIKDKATEAIIKQQNSPTILHISTHGYFVNIDNEGLNRLLNLDKKKATPEEKFAVMRFVTDTFSTYQTEPTLHSGLVLVGANNNKNSETILNDDGLLTAYEANGLDLAKTELVVLSGCQTGDGILKNGEGLYGLQRSFQVAGSKSTIVSLWKVKDHITQRFMTLFYTNWLQNGLPKQDAFRKAQLEIKENECCSDALYWGAFLLVGL